MPSFLSLPHHSPLCLLLYDAFFLTLDRWPYLRAFKKVRLLYVSAIKRSEFSCLTSSGTKKPVDWIREDENKATVEMKSEGWFRNMAARRFYLHVSSLQHEFLKSISLSCWLKLTLILLIPVSGAKTLPRSFCSPPLKILFSVKVMGSPQRVLGNTRSNKDKTTFHLCDLFLLWSAHMFPCVSLLQTQV